MSSTFMYRFIGSNATSGSSYLMPKFTYVKSLAKTEEDPSNQASYNATIDRNGNWTISLLESGFLRFYYLKKPLTVNIFCCGGGGGGATANPHYNFGGGGGGGGYVSNSYDIELNEEYIYAIFVGPGGEGAPKRYLYQKKIGKVTSTFRDGNEDVAYDISNGTNNANRANCGGWVGERGMKGRSTMWFKIRKPDPENNNTKINEIQGLGYYHTHSWEKSDSQGMGIVIKDEITRPDQTYIIPAEYMDYNDFCILVPNAKDPSQTAKIAITSIINDTTGTIKTAYPIEYMLIDSTETNINKWRYVGAEGGFGGDYYLNGNKASGCGGNGGSGGGQGGTGKSSNLAGKGGVGGSNGEDGAKVWQKNYYGSSYHQGKGQRSGQDEEHHNPTLPGGSSSALPKNMRAFEADIGLLYGSGGAGGSGIYYYNSKSKQITVDSASSGGTAGSTNGGGDSGSFPQMLVWKGPPEKRGNAEWHLAKDYVSGDNTYSVDGSGKNGRANTGGGGGGGSWMWDEYLNGKEVAIAWDGLHLDKGYFRGTLSNYKVWVNENKSDTTIGTLATLGLAPKNFYRIAFKGGDGGSGISIIAGKSTITLGENAQETGDTNDESENNPPADPNAPSTDNENGEGSD